VAPDPEGDVSKVGRTVSHCRILEKLGGGERRAPWL